MLTLSPCSSSRCVLNLRIFSTWQRSRGILGNRTYGFRLIYFSWRPGYKEHHVGDDLFVDDTRIETRDRNISKLHVPWCREAKIKVDILIVTPTF
ncbi:hypothetical protein Pmani_003817 [Petrolisthes manimaculis]|uniref:Uncharacterized protein n=1 Tax=Petrolisthes manimaculis TaxID=1843537 RepID=A0AAE1UNY0_9EUCA|nr:hypothetical protein Pmani_003817 [Petrolisthes manimaculis]